MDPKNKKEREMFQKIWAQVLARAWSDKKFKERLFLSPEEVLKEYGLSFPGKKIEIIEMTPSEEYLFFGAAPQGDFSEEQLKKIAAGSGIAQAYHSVMTER
jgi:hypothetical protein